MTLVRFCEETREALIYSVYIGIARAHRAVILAIAQVSCNNEYRAACKALRVKGAKKLRIELPKAPRRCGWDEGVALRTHQSSANYRSFWKLSYAARKTLLIAAIFTILV